MKEADSIDESVINVKGEGDMKKLFLILAIVVILPVAVFAEWGIGGAAFYKSPVLLGQPVDIANLNVNQFGFGGDVRLKVGWFQFEGLLLYSAGDINSLNMFLDAGVALDLAIIRLSLGAVPTSPTTSARARLSRPDSTPRSERTSNWDRSRSGSPTSWRWTSATALTSQPAPGCWAPRFCSGCSTERAVSRRQPSISHAPIWSKTCGNRLRRTGDEALRA